MKTIVNSNFKNSLSLSLNRKILKFPLKQVRSSEGIRNQQVFSDRMEIVKLNICKNYFYIGRRGRVQKRKSWDCGIE
jgi:hypothetical protein